MMGECLLGLALVKVEKEIWEEVFPEHTHTHLCILCPLSIGTITTVTGTGVGSEGTHPQP